MNVVKGVIIGPMDKNVTLHHKSHFYLTLHINSLNSRLSNHGHSMVGAFCFVVIGTRHSQDFSLPSAPRGRSTCTFPMSKLSNLHPVDPINAKEIFVKWDMLQPQLYSRAISQMVDADDYSRWMVNSKERLKKYCKDNNKGHRICILK